MKCLCCNQSSTDQISLKDYYVISHDIDENNCYFENFLQGINVLCQENFFVATISV